MYSIVGVQFSFFPCGYPVVPVKPIEKIIFSHVVLLPSEITDHICVDLFLSLLFHSVVLFILALKPFCLSKALYFSYSWILAFHITFGVSLWDCLQLSLVHTQTCWILIGLILSLINLGIIDIFMILSLLIHECGIFLHLFLFWLLSIIVFYLEVLLIFYFWELRNF